MFGGITPVVRNILIINVVILILNSVLGNRLNELFGLYTVLSDNFQPYQLFTYMWLHGGFMHLLFNMIGVFFFGPVLERMWGVKRFLIFYFVVGIGAGVLYGVADYFEKAPTINDAEVYINNPNPDDFYLYTSKHLPKYLRSRVGGQIYDFYDEYSKNPNSDRLIQESRSWVSQISDLAMLGNMVGASGAVYGILMAFGLLFPNTTLMLLFPPIPIKAKYLVFILGVIALYSQINRQPDDNVAHLAHLGGMLIAYIMLRVWRIDRSNFY